MQYEIILSLENLTKKYGSTRAVDGISFAIRRGEVVGLLGPNGAGKTTTINMILGILEPTGGKLSIFSQDARQDRAIINQKLNFSAVYAQLPANLTVWQNLYTFGLLYGVKNLKEKIHEIIKEYDLEKFTNVKTGLLSSGELSRVNLAKAFINCPELLLLDEPTASLDPDIAQTIREKIRSYARKNHTAILWTSHNMKEVEEVCDRVLFISKGKIILSGNPKTLAREHQKKDLEELFISVARQPLDFEE